MNHDRTDSIFEPSQAWKREFPLHQTSVLPKFAYNIEAQILPLIRAQDCRADLCRPFNARNGSKILTFSFIFHLNNHDNGKTNLGLKNENMMQILPSIAF